MDGIHSFISYRSQSSRHLILDKLSANILLSPVMCFNSMLYSCKINNHPVILDDKVFFPNKFRASVFTIILFPNKVVLNVFRISIIPSNSFSGVE